MKDSLHLVFAANSSGAIRESRVSLAKALRIYTVNSVVKCHLQIDDGAFEWLRSNNWHSGMVRMTVTGWPQL